MKKTVAVICSIIILSALSQAQDWPQLQRDPQHTGRTSVSVTPANTAAWVWVDEQHLTRNFVSQRDASINYPNPRSVILAGDVQPIVAGDRLFFGATNGGFYALNATNGATVWKKQLGGPVLHTAAHAGGAVVTGCMDWKLYAFDAATGNQLWTFTARAGFSVAPIIADNRVYAGSRDGWFYAVNLTSGSLAWKYRTVAVNGGHPHSGAAIMQSAALSADGATVFFGAENMYFYALNAATGSEVWRRKLGGQSFMYSWPVVFNGMVMTFVTVPHGGSEYVAEEVLDALPSKNSGESARDYATRIWPQERDALRTWLGQHPEYRNFYAMKVSDGTDAFSQEIPMGRVGGIGYPNRAPVVDNQNRILLYWRTRSASFLTGGTFGTKYTPDISALDQTTGDRVILPVSSGEGVEIDNTFMLSVGGNNLYWNNHMRGARKIDMTNGNPMRMSQVLAEWDGANYRNWGDKLIWIGNDSSPASMPPPSAHRSPQGDCSVVLASVGGKSMMFIQESGHYQINFGCIAAVEGN